MIEELLAPWRRASTLHQLGHVALGPGSWWAHLEERAVSGPRWREVGHALLALPLGVLGVTVAVITWCGSLGLILLPAVVGAMPDDTARFWLFAVGFGPALFGLALIGLVVLLVVAEALTNVARHARATRAWVSLVRSGDRLTVEIRDDGVGGQPIGRHSPDGSSNCSHCCLPGCHCR